MKIFSSVSNKPAVDGYANHPESTSISSNPSAMESPEPAKSGPAPSARDPIPVVKVYSTRGVEYGMMTICLWLIASSLAWALINLINGSGSFDFLVVPASILITSVPIFGLLFIRLRRAELANPELRLEPSKRRWSQLTQFLAFIAVLINLTYLSYALLQHFANDKSYSLAKTAASVAVVLVIAGGVLVYYWFDEHRAPNR